jgi:hypothetical protein
MGITVKVIGARKTANYYSRLSRETKRATRRGALNVAKSVQRNARNILDRKTTKHTGLLWQDVRIKPKGGKGSKSYWVTVGEMAPYAYLIEHGRKAMPGRKFIKTQDFPLEGVSIPSPFHSIAAYPGIHFMRDATNKTRLKAREIIEKDIRRAERR